MKYFTSPRITRAGLYGCETMKVAYIDNDQDVLELMMHYFEQKGHEIELCTAPQELEELDGLDVIITDSDIGRDTWADTMNFANTYHRGKPVIVYTADQYVVLELMGAGIPACVKTSDPQQIITLAEAQHRLYKLEESTWEE